MSSGVAVNPDCLSQFQTLKLGKKLKYIIFSLNKTFTEIVVEKTSEDEDYDNFIASLPEQEPRFAVYDFPYEKDGGQRSKITFITWAPDDAKIRQKMVYASSKDALRKALQGIAAEIQATEFDEISREVVHDKVSRGN